MGIVKPKRPSVVIRNLADVKNHIDEIWRYLEEVFDGSLFLNNQTNNLNKETHSLEDKLKQLDQKKQELEKQINQKSQELQELEKRVKQELTELSKTIDNHIDNLNKETQGLEDKFKQLDQKRQELETQVNQELTELSNLTDSLSVKQKKIESDITILDEKARLLRNSIEVGKPKIVAGVFKDDTPIAGRVAWEDISIFYNFKVIEIGNGDTNKKYIYWDTANQGVLQTTDNISDLYIPGKKRFLIGVNDNGIFKNFAVHRLVHGMITDINIVDFSIIAPKLNTHSFYINQSTSPFSINTGTGQISWTAFEIIYNGTKYSISAGSTNSKYVYWVPGETVLQSDNSYLTAVGSQNSILITYKYFTGSVWQLFDLYNKRATYYYDMIEGDGLKNNTVRFSKLVTIPNRFIGVNRTAYHTDVISVNNLFNSPGVYTVYTFGTRLSERKIPYMRMLISYRITLPANERLSLIWRLKIGTSHYPNVSYGSFFKYNLSANTVASGHILESDNTHGIMIGYFDGDISGLEGDMIGGHFIVTLSNENFDGVYVPQNIHGITSQSVARSLVRSSLTSRVQSGATIYSTCNGFFAGEDIELKLEVVTKNGTNNASVQFFPHIEYSPPMNIDWDGLGDF
jgi:prefoldin subunit 5